MSDRKTLLILGGTSGSRALAGVLKQEFGGALRIITSLAGRTSDPKAVEGEIRIGGFGGAEGLSTYLSEIDADLLIDATHPFAAQISRHALDASHASSVPLLTLQRAPWVEQPGDDWTHVNSVQGAAEVLPDVGARCLITTGINELEPYAHASGVQLFVRLIETPKKALPVPDADIIIGKLPYKLDEEVALFQMLGIDTLVTKNAGGSGTAAKIDAARKLGVKVVMISRPCVQSDNTVASVSDAAAFVKRRLGL